MIVSFRIEIPVPYNRSHRPHLRRRLCGGRLVVVAQNDSYLRPLESSHAVGGGEDVVLGEQRSAAVKVAIVDDSSYPRIVVDAGGMAAHYTILVIGKTALCGKGCEGVYIVLGVTSS